MEKDESRRRAAFYDELPAVLRPVVGAAEDDEAVGIVRSTLGEEVDVVDVHEDGVPTSWNRAPATMTPHDFAPHGRRNVLPGAGRRSSAHVGVGEVLAWMFGRDSLLKASHVLRVTGGHLHDLWTDLDLLASPLLRSATAPFAYRHGKLVVGPSRIGRAGEDLARQEEQRRIVVDGGCRVSSDLRHGFSERGERVRRDLEPKDVAYERFIR
jgi:hypothetical protein